MATKAIQDRGRLVERDRIVRVIGGRSRLNLGPLSTTIGLGALTMAVYVAFLLAGAVIVGKLVAITPGIAKVVLLFTVGLLIISAAPTIANWTLTRILEFSKGN